MSDLAELDKVKYRKWEGVVLNVEVDSAVGMIWCSVMFREWRELSGWRHWCDRVNATDLIKIGGE